MELRWTAPGEIYLANFPFGAGGGSKLRPVFLLTGPLGSVPEFLVAYISSVVPSQLLDSDVLIDPGTADHAGTNLKTISVLRLHKLATILQRSIFRLLGCVSPATQAEVASKLRAMLGL
jgi:mRNA-degrading endonuclease toxin of MazEF toxin-antitoxin module